MTSMFDDTIHTFENDHEFYKFWANVDIDPDKVLKNDVKRIESESSLQGWSVYTWVFDIDRYKVSIEVCWWGPAHLMCHIYYHKIEDCVGTCHAGKTKNMPDCPEGGWQGTDSWIGLKAKEQVVDYIQSFVRHYN